MVDELAMINVSLPPSRSPNCELNPLELITVSVPVPAVARRTKLRVPPFPKFVTVIAPLNDMVKLSSRLVMDVSVGTLFWSQFPLLLES